MEDKKFDQLHNDALKYGISVFGNLLDDKYNYLKNCIYFTGGTSLFFKYSNSFGRFSTDLDFSIQKECNKKYEKDLSFLIMEIKENISSFLREKNVILYDANSNREINFQGTENVRSIKFDWMPDFILEKEILNINNQDIFKSSDFDILLNKLIRLSNIDISDIKFILKKNKDITSDKILNGLQEKGKQLHGNKYYFEYYLNIYGKKHIRELPFLKQIID